ncbi:SemiSWEET family transporter [Kineococcus rubinsiae]|uniref:SemiSWEET family transporter n=1 Tax=Kineococcus rubinsiae TaxID=2609562 RepID=UPI001431D2EB|nr:SemiSWEET family transporter [Kineococcus rubinsiae]NIZ91444.1 hypothetical protein [Kineococcus rubinsiae]
MPVLSLISFLGLVAAALGILTGLPQVVRLVRTPDASGLSYSSAVLGVLSSATWLTYGVMLLDPAQLLANVPGVTCAVVTAVLSARRLGLRLARTWQACAAWALVVAAAAVLGGPAVVGMAATVVSLVKMLPQVRTVLRREPLTGLAPATFFLTQVSATTWTVYGLATGQVSVVVCSLVSVVLAGVVLSRRCPPRAVVRALHHGRWGVPGRLLVRPVMMLAA